MELNRPVWAEVNLDNLAHNIKEVRRISNKGTKITAVVKADGYGHGAVIIASTLLENGADRLAVATLTEAIQLRKVYHDVEILILGYTEKESVYLAIKNSLIQTVYTLGQAVVFNAIAKAMGILLKVHIKLDTGMTRLGMISEEKTVREIEAMTELEFIEIEGIYTHFALADEKDKNFTHKQVEKFKFICDGLREKKIIIPIQHVSNSAAIIDLPEYNLDMVRAGIMLYGLYPSADVDHQHVKLKEVMSLHAKISRVQEVADHVGVSYGHKYKTRGKRLIASLPIGYADGYSRRLSLKATAIVKGQNKTVPVVGTICMDQCMIDVTGLNVSIGDEVILFGTDMDQTITIDDIANKMDTINYEVVCMINRRVPRVYTKNTGVVETVDYIMKL